MQPKNSIYIKKRQQQWNRRDFLFTTGLASLGSILNLNPLYAANNSSSLTDENRILVLLELYGGNDGLNMIIPHSNAVGKNLYRSYRPNIALYFGTDYTENTFLSGYGNTNYALPNQMQALMPMWNNDQMKVIHNVGYSESNQEHLQAASIGATAENNFAMTNYASGWLGRFLENDFNDLEYPLGVQIGSTNRLQMRGVGTSTFGIHFTNPAAFYRLINSGEYFNTDGFTNCPKDQERMFVRQRTNETIRFANQIQTAFNPANNSASANYPSTATSDLQEQFKIVANLIKGGLGTKVYSIRLNGFDTHTDQLTGNINQPSLLQDLAECIQAFYADLSTSNLGNSVLTMTHSEFGRTIKENNTNGTDHGTTSPILLFSGGINGGFTGTPLDLNDTSLQQGNTTIPFNQNSIDYRQVYATILQDWLCVNPLIINAVLGKHYNRIEGLFQEPCIPSEVDTESLLGYTTKGQLIDFRYAITSGSNVRLSLLDSSGNTIHVLVDEYKNEGVYLFTFDLADYNLSTGLYQYRLEVEGEVYTRKLML